MSYNIKFSYKGRVISCKRSNIEKCKDLVEVLDLAIKYTNSRATALLVFSYTTGDRPYIRTMYNNYRKELLEMLSVRDINDRSLDFFNSRSKELCLFPIERVPYPSAEITELKRKLDKILYPLNGGY